MTTEEYLEAQTAAGKCEICRQFPAVVAYEKRGKRGRIIERVEMCQHCAIIDPCNVWHEAGAANSIYGVNEYAKRDLIALIVDEAKDKDFTGFVRTLCQSFRSKKLPRGIRRIKDQLDERLAVLNMTVADAEPVKTATNEEDESYLEHVLFGYSKAVTIGMSILIGSMLAACLIAQAVKWMGR